MNKKEKHKELIAKLDEIIKELRRMNPIVIPDYGPVKQLDPWYMKTISCR